MSKLHETHAQTESAPYHIRALNQSPETGPPGRQ
jgi:hypothetical protein